MSAAAGRPHEGRPRPVPTDDDRAFWGGGRRGELRINRCRRCRRWSHPPAPVCPSCYCTEVSAEAVSGRGHIFAYTVNHQPWFPSMPPPYIVAIVELDDQPGLRLMTNVVDCAVDAVTEGMAVEVLFDRIGDVWLPLFRPATAS